MTLFVVIFSIENVEQKMRVTSQLRTKSSQTQGTGIKSNPSTYCALS